MGISERLDEMRCEVPGCSLVSFGDLSTGLALRTSAIRQHKQEYLEELLAQAAISFGISDKAMAASGKRSRFTVQATSEEVRIFVRSGSNATDVLCCVCDSASRVRDVAISAQRIFDEVAGHA